MPKRLIVACDGTWLDSDEGVEWSMGFNGDKTLQRPSNITRLCRAINTKDKNGIYQIVDYVAGVGSEDSISSRITGGALGAGIDKNIRQAYRFIRQNYEPSDEIVIMGFSRGAFTAQCIAHLINDIGLLRTDYMEDFIAIYQAWIEPWKGAGDSDSNATGWLADGRKVFNIATGKDSRPRSDVTHHPVPIKALACYDTVSSLRGGYGETYKFADTTLRPVIQNAIHALALDEERVLFPPEVWAKNKGDKANLVQCWFPGAHSNVGGCYSDTNSSDISLTWMVEQLKKANLEFDENYVVEQHSRNLKYYSGTEDGHKPEPFRPWSVGLINDSAHTTMVSRAAEKVSFLENRITKKRTPGVLQDFEDKTDLITNETIHASARARMEMKGKGPDDDGPYVPDAFQEGGKPTYEKGSSGVTWTFKAKDGDGNVGTVTLPEAKLEPMEVDMIKRSLDALKKSPDSKDKAANIKIMESFINGA